jgi:hypothetical protein
MKTITMIAELLLQGHDLIQIRDCLEDGEYLASTDMTEAEAEEAHHEVKRLISIYN